MPTPNPDMPQLRHLVQQLIGLGAILTFKSVNNLIAVNIIVGHTQWMAEYETIFEVVEYLSKHLDENFKVKN